MAEPKERPVVVTHLGHAGDGFHIFRGFEVGRELVGRQGFWSVLSLGIGGPKLGAREVALLDELATSLLGPDPRIWPWKLSRLMSAYGRFSAGVGGPLMMMSSGRVGPAVLGGVARFFAELGEELGPALDDEQALSDALDRRLAESPRPPGFGTPFRHEDERNGPIIELVKRHGREHERYFSLAERAARLVLQKKRLPVNAAAFVATICLDLGYSPAQIDVFGVVLLLTNVIANAFEGSQEPPAVLRCLPADCVRYVGPAPRSSPRRAGEATP